MGVAQTRKRLQPGPVQTEAGLEIGQGAGHGQPLLLKFGALAIGEGQGLLEADGLNAPLTEAGAGRQGQSRGTEVRCVQVQWTRGRCGGPQQGRPDAGWGSRGSRPGRRGGQHVVQQPDVLIDPGPGALQLADARLTGGRLGFRRCHGDTKSAGESDRQQAWGQGTPGDDQRGSASFWGIRKARGSWAGP